MTAVKRVAALRNTFLLVLAFVTAILTILATIPFTASAALLNPSSSGFGGQTRSVNYDALLDALYANGNVTTTIGDKLWVPWFGTSSGCAQSDLKAGSGCNSGQAIDFSHNCMVTDEFSQVGILVSMGDDQARMDAFYNTVRAINSSYGRIPAWRVYRNGNTIEQCRSGINGNCDTASDATARIIIALYTASDNPLFADAAQKARYGELAHNLSGAFLKYEVVNSCKQSSLGHGDICWWLAAGSNSKNGGMSGTDFGYTGYYPDAIIAMLQACAQTENMTYCQVAGNFTLNYLQASKWDGANFRVPPGRSFRWTNLTGIPVAECTNTCNPDQWDGADAPRALGMCHANYYAHHINITLPGLDAYCDAWGTRYMNTPSSAPYQYHADGTNSASYQSGYFAQGLQALFQSGGHDPSLFAPTLDSALSHYSTSTRTWDWTACFGVYTQAFAVRALGFGIGRDEASFPVLASFGPGAGENVTAPVVPADDTNQTNTTNLPDVPAQTPTQNATQNTTTNTTQNVTTDSTQNTTESTNVTNETVPLQDIGFATYSPGLPMTITEPDNQTFTFVLDNPDNLAYAASWLLNGRNQTAAFNKSAYAFAGNYSSAGTWNVTLLIISTQNNLSHTFLLTVADTALNASPPANLTNATNQTNTTDPPEIPAETPTQNVTQNDTFNGTQNDGPAPTLNSTNSTSNGTNLSNSTTPDAPTRDTTPTTLRGGGGGGGIAGGGGGGSTLSGGNGGGKKVQASTADASVKEERLKSTIDSYFAGDVTTQTLVSELRKYYGVS